jgi:prolyl-tRNA synthetase
MGSYGIGITRTPQAALEKYFDDHGIIWPVGIAPYLVEIIPLNLKDDEIVAASEKLYVELNEAGIDVLLDDRSERAGVKFNDADLVGMPVRVTIGAKSLKDNKVEVKLRSSDEVEKVDLNTVVDYVKNVIQTLK